MFPETEILEQAAALLWIFKEKFLLLFFCAIVRGRKRDFLVTVMSCERRAVMDDDVKVNSTLCEQHRIHFCVVLY